MRFPKPSSTVLALLLAAVASGCGGSRRPPVVATTGPAPAPAAEAETAPGASADAGQPLDAGPDVRPLREDSASGHEILGGGGGEGGPLSDIPFEYDRAVLGQAALETLRGHAQWLQQHPDTKATIEGHCDQRGTVEYNLALGDLRAQAVREYLVSLGVAAERLQTVSYGKERPLDPEMTDAAWARNRRAHFVVTR